MLPSTAPLFCGERLSEFVQLVTPHLRSPVDAVRAASFVCIGEALENVPQARAAYADEWLTVILQALTDPQQPLPVKHKVCLPLIQLATAPEDDEEETGEGRVNGAAASSSALSASQAERISGAVLPLLQQLKEEGMGAGAEAKAKWQLVALLAAAMESTGQ